MNPRSTSARVPGKPNLANNKSRLAKVLPAQPRLGAQGSMQPRSGVTTRDRGGKGRKRAELQATVLLDKGQGQDGKCCRRQLRQHRNQRLGLFKAAEIDAPVWRTIKKPPLCRGGFGSTQAVRPRGDWINRSQVRLGPRGWTGQRRGRGGSCERCARASLPCPGQRGSAHRPRCSAPDPGNPRSTG